VDLARLRLEPRQHRVAVFAAAVVDRLAEDDVQAGERPQLLRLVHLPRALGVHVYLLERDEVGLLRGDHGGDAGKVELAVGPFAVVDVVGEHAQARRVLGRGAGGEEHAQCNESRCEDSGGGGSCRRYSGPRRCVRGRRARR
jgi:hypothetical protein